MATGQKGSSREPAGKPTSAPKRTEKRGRARETKRGNRKKDVFPIVGIGASAGGLQALGEVLENLSPDLGMAYVVVQHLSPDHESALQQVLERQTLMVVTDAEDGDQLEKDHLYVLPPDRTVRVEGGRLRLEKRDRTKFPMPIDLFLESLAEDQHERAIAVILSGNGSDGTFGIRAVKENGGIAIAQDDSALHRAMPQSAIGSGFVDYVLDPLGIARELSSLSEDPYLRQPEGESVVPKGKEERSIKRIFQLLRRQTGVNFEDYKLPTTTRRIRRRMAIHRIATISEYADYIESNPAEAGELHHDMLIRVTSFFRDPAVFEFLKTDVLPPLLGSRGADEPFRVWVPGCATGEEVYTIAILLDELNEETDKRLTFQIFGTDVSDRSIEFAREGVYPENIVQQLSTARIERYFTKLDGRYKISRHLRDACIFARQDLTKDPPFSKLDLVTCRNVLIYLDRHLQRQVFSILRYALNIDGVLVLGSSETTGPAADAFEPLHRKLRIYRKTTNDRRLPLTTTKYAAADGATSSRTAPLPTRGSQRSLLEEADHVVLHQVAPPGVLIDEDFDVVQFRGRTSRFLEPPPGAPTFNLLKMVRQGLLAELRTGVERARRTRERVSRTNVRVRINGDEVFADLEIIPLDHDNHKRHFLVMFTERAQRPADESGASAISEESSLRMKRELESTREYLQSIIEEQEAMNEELRSANEEIQSSNEELQSTNEELETAKEELQSSNEELTTLNEELTIRNQELDRLNDDLVNILSSIEIPIVILDGEMRLRRFNQSAQQILSVIPDDVGRPIRDLRAGVEIDRLESTARNVIETLALREIDIRGPDGVTHHLQIRPYKTTDNRIDGVVMTFLETRKEEHQS